MIELPEAQTLATQLNAAISGKQIAGVVAARSPHKFAWYNGDPRLYQDLLTGKTVGGAVSYGGMVEIGAGDAALLFGDGVSLRFHAAGESRPDKHQLLVEFTDGAALSATVQMYGGLWAFPTGEFANPYYLGAKAKTSPLASGFDRVYFSALVDVPEVQKLSAKAFLATEQRIPGLGNGVLQDILYNAGIHPKRKLGTLTGEDRDRLFDSIKATLTEMVAGGGRDTEKDLYGNPGGYSTWLSKNTAGQYCAKCGGMIVKESYLGGSIYYCGGCQRL